MGENEQLAKLSRSQETITRILEDVRQHRDRLPGNTDGAMLPKNEPTDEEVDFLVEGIAKEVAVIGALCDSLHDRLESICGDVDGSCSSSRQDRHGGEPPSGSRFRPHPA
jgi:hypothetical protein